METRRAPLKCLVDLKRIERSVQSASTAFFLNIEHMDTQKVPQYKFF